MSKPKKSALIKDIEYPASFPAPGPDLGRRIGHPSYHRHIYNTSYLRDMVDRVSRNLSDLQGLCRFDAIAVTGSSGLSVAFPVSYKTGISVIHVRREIEVGHCHGCRIEGPEGAVRRYFVVDDTVSSGRTVRWIVSQLHREGLHCVGIGLHNEWAKSPSSQRGTNYVKDGESMDRGGLNPKFPLSTGHLLPADFNVPVYLI